MQTHCYTSFSLAYLSRARVLAQSVRKFHPDWTLWAVISDRCPDGFEFGDTEPFDRVIWATDLFGEAGPAWFFRHNVVEACTGVKGRALQTILDAPDCGKVIYFDPDIAVFSDLSAIPDVLDDAAVALTPHQLHPETDDLAIRDNEIASLHYGTFNLGFLAIRNCATGRRVADWWAARLDDYCHDRLDIGVFVDQKWFNLVPCFFEGVEILRHPGYNVASWNISQRKLAITREGDITVNGAPLGFYHFTKIGGDGDVMTRRYAASNTDIHEIWTWYRLELERMAEPRIPPGWWAFGRFDDGQPVMDSMRRLYRARRDLQEAFPQPYLSGPGTLQAWFAANASELRDA